MTDVLLPFLATAAALSSALSLTLLLKFKGLQGKLGDALETNADLAIVVNQHADQVATLETDLQERTDRLAMLEALVDELQAAQVSEWQLPLASAGD